MKLQLNLKHVCYTSSIMMAAFALFLVCQAIFHLTWLGQLYWLFETSAVLGLCGFFVGVSRYPQQLPDSTLWWKLLTLVIGIGSIVAFFIVNNFSNMITIGRWFRLMMIMSIIMALYMFLMGKYSHCGTISNGLRKYCFTSFVVVAIAFVVLAICYCGFCLDKNSFAWAHRIMNNVTRISMYLTFVMFVLLYFINQLRMEDFAHTTATDSPTSPLTPTKKNPIAITSIILGVLLLVGLLSVLSVYSYHQFQSQKNSRGHQECNSIYHWKTTYNLSEYEKQWLKDNDVHRIYIKMYDVESVQMGNGYDLIPTATTTFPQAVIKEGMEYVPTVYITLNALRLLEEGHSVEETAEKILKRTLNMADYYDFPPIKELQIDCDWTESLQDAFFNLCRCMRDSLHERNILLSSTIRLHQLRTLEPPVDRGVLMLYNVGDIRNYRTKNSIIEPRMMKDYLSHYNYHLPLDIALPTFSWGACFRDGKFGCILRQTDYSDTMYFDPIGDNRYRLKFFLDIEGHWLHTDDEIRVESCSVDSIIAVKNILPQELMDAGVIIYHLDSTNLSNYNHEEISQLYHIGK